MYCLFSVAVQTDSYSSGNTASHYAAQNVHEVKVANSLPGVRACWCRILESSAWIYMSCGLDSYKSCIDGRWSVPGSSAGKLDA